MCTSFCPASCSGFLGAHHIPYTHTAMGQCFILGKCCPSLGACDWCFPSKPTIKSTFEQKHTWAVSGGQCPMRAISDNLCPGPAPSPSAENGQRRGAPAARRKEVGGVSRGLTREVRVHCCPVPEPQARTAGLLMNAWLGNRSEPSVGATRRLGCPPGSGRSPR